jgi:hypothetical protein
MVYNKDKSFLDQEWFSLKQVGVFLLALLAFTIPWTWRVATTHHEFILLKETQALEKSYQDEQNTLMQSNHEKDAVIIRLQAKEHDERINGRVDKKTQRNTDEIEILKAQFKELHDD